MPFSGKALIRIDLDPLGDQESGTGEEEKKPPMSESPRRDEPESSAATWASTGDIMCVRAYRSIHMYVWGGGNANWGAGFGTNEAPLAPIFGVDFSVGFTSPIQF